MKLRIKGNTIRLRLTKSEVDYFGEHLRIEEQTQFGTTSFYYALHAEDIGQMRATFEQNRIMVSVPMKQALEWVGTDAVGCDSEMDIGGGRKLFLLVEKDFKCLDETVEDQSDNYENPLASSHKK